MIKALRRRNIPREWFAAIAWYGFIFILSSIPDTKINAMPPVFLRIISEFSGGLLRISEETSLFWGHRFTHFVEYCILGILMARARVQRLRGIPTGLVICLASLIFVCAVGDEWHQTFVPGRCGQWIDVIFDTICGALGVMVVKWSRVRKAP